MIFSYKAWYLNSPNICNIQNKLKKILLISLISLIISGCVKTITPSSLEQVSNECMKDYILSKKFVEMSYKKDNYEYNPILFDFADESNFKKTHRKRAC